MGVGAVLSMYVVVVRKFTFAISSPDEFLFFVPETLTLTFELGPDFCTVHLTAKFHRLVCNRSEVIVLTDKQTEKQTDAAEKIHLAPLCYAGG